MPYYPRTHFLRSLYAFLAALLKVGANRVSVGPSVKLELYFFYTKLMFLKIYFLDASQVIMFQDEKGEYLTVGAGGVLKVKMGARDPRREEFFAIHTPSAHVRLWAFNNKFACNKHGKSSIFLH